VSGAVQFVSGAVQFVSGAVQFVSGAVQFVSGAVQFVLCLKDRVYKYFCNTTLTTSSSSIFKLSPFFRVQNQATCP